MGKKEEQEKEVEKDIRIQKKEGWIMEEEFDIKIMQVTRGNKKVLKIELQEKG